jgi:type II secretory pathway pseudopilin PulG
MKTKHSRSRSVLSTAGFSLLELVLVCAILGIVLASVFSGIQVVINRSQAEQTKVDLTQEGREFVDEFERDVHQVGYPNCRMVGTQVAGVLVVNSCPPANDTVAVAQNTSLAVGIVYLSNTKVVFEGDVDGNGVVDEVQYELVDSAGNYPPTATCPCTIKRSQLPKIAGSPLTGQTPPTFSQELNNVVNSGVPGGTLAYGNGLSIAGNTACGATANAFYAALTSFKDYPVFQAYDQSGNIIALPLDISTTNGVNTLTCSANSVSCVKEIRLTINLLANATTGADMTTRVRPVTTLVGDARLVNN